MGLCGPWASHDRLLFRPSSLPAQRTAEAQRRGSTLTFVGRHLSGLRALSGGWSWREGADGADSARRKGRYGARSWVARAGKLKKKNRLSLSENYNARPSFKKHAYPDMRKPELSCKADCSVGTLSVCDRVWRVCALGPVAGEEAVPGVEGWPGGEAVRVRSLLRLWRRRGA